MIVTITSVDILVLYGGGSKLRVQMIIIVLEPTNVLHFGASTLLNEAFSNQNRGPHLGSRVTYSDS